ncbi:hypothetical protein MHU86_10130 [Fragilaria crotonensis]|nr:hypothetical protein MHU86_10130 [Fragilaria crotonensis]
MSIQDLMCHAIAKLPKNATLKEVSKQLNPILSVDSQAKVSSSGLDVTPLMVACDKGQAACLEYMLLNPNAQLWGRADAHSSPQSGCNTALHHAAVAGCVEALDALENMGCSLRDLAKSTNEHGDTPIMMACVYNQFIFLSKLKAKLGDDSFAESLHAKNSSGDGPLSLAFFEGHTNVVDLLLSSGVDASYEVVQECREKLREIDAVLRTTGVQTTKEIEFRRTNVAKCLEFLESKLAKKCQDSMEHLLQKETQDEALRQTTAVKKSSELVPRRKGNRKTDPEKKDIRDVSFNDDTCQKVWDKQQLIQSMTVEKVSQPKFRTLPDGSVVKSVSDLQLHDVSLVSPPVVPATQHRKSVDEMLRECLRDPRNHDSSIDAVMDSLCLDASMLLLSPHGMAMTLSPSQLEAIDSILRQQVKSVLHAKQIQARLLKTEFRTESSV